MKRRRIQNPASIDRILFLGLMVLGWLLQTQAQQHGSLLVVPALQSTIEAKPGTTVAAAIKVTNVSSLRLTCETIVALPSGWKQVLRDSPFEMQPADSSIRLIPFSIPSTAPAGMYAILVKAQNAAQLGRADTCTIIVMINRVVQLELKPFRTPRFAAAGSTFQTIFLLTNKGNSLDTVQLEYRSSHDFPVRMDSPFVCLGPKETREIPLDVTTDEKAEKLNHTLELKVRSTLDTTVRSRISSVVEIIPQASASKEDFLVYPVSLKVREIGQEGKYFTQAEVSGVGNLREDRLDQFEFLFRTPETQSVSLLGLRDEYRVSYRTDSLLIYAGDQNFSLSPLSELGRYASGLGGQVLIDEMSIGAFYNETRWIVPRQKEIGGFFNYRIREGTTLGVNVLNKKDQSESTITTLRGTLIPFSGSELDLEFGIGKKNGLHDNAYSARFDGFQKWISYDLRYIHAGPDFGGYYRDMNYFSAGINAQPARNLHILANLREETRNLAYDTNQVYAPHDTYLEMGAGYSDIIGFSYRYNGQDDRFDSVQYMRREDAVQIRGGYNLFFLSMFAHMDLGTKKDLLRNIRLPFKRFSLYTSFKPAAQQSYSTSIEYETDQDTTMNRTQERLSANLSAWIFFSRSTMFQLNLYGSRLIAPQTQTYSMMDATFEHVFPFDHKVVLRGRLSNMTPAAATSEFTCALEYTIPLGIPIKRISGMGQLRGSLTDEQGKGIAHVPVNAGSEAALSDNNGNFYFHSLKPGTIYLTIDKAAIGFDRITLQATPLEILIRGGEESHLSLNVTRSVHIEGNITLFALKEQNMLDSSTTLNEVGGKSGVFLELANNTEVHRRVSDNRGRFSFGDLRPGTWTLKVAGGDIPAYHTIDPELSTMNLAPGEKKQITIQLRPRKRIIKMLNEGSVIQEARPQIVKKTGRQKTNKQENCLITFDQKRKGYILQISSWMNISRARRAVKKAEKMTGLKAFIETVVLSSKKRSHRVYIGIFKNEADALDCCRRYKF